MKPPSSNVRPAVQAGRFYEADPALLREEITRALRAARIPQPNPVRIQLLLAPHAGHAYCSRVAAAAYRQVQGRDVDGVLMLGPSHYEDFSGVGLPSYHSFATPLGLVPIDREGVAELCADAAFRVHDAAHGPEHCIEVELPFLQVALGDEFRLLPLLFGRSDLEQLSHIASVLRVFLDRRRDRQEEWLVVVSTDTYHGYDRQDCSANDREIAGLISEMDGPSAYEAFQSHRAMACGWRALTAAMLLGGAPEGVRGVVLERSDSDEATGRKEGYVVGYISAVAGGVNAD